MVSLVVEFKVLIIDVLVKNVLFLVVNALFLKFESESIVLKLSTFLKLSGGLLTFDFFMNV